MLNIRRGGGRGCATFCKCSDRPSGQNSLLYNWYQDCFSGVERPVGGEREVETPPHSSAEFLNERIYTSTPASVHVIGLTSPLP